MTIPELRLKLGNELGFSGWFSTWDGSAASFANLSLDDRVKLTNAMDAYIRAHPDEFSTVQQTLANRDDISAPVEYGVGDMVADFGSEVLNQADALNPLSPQNRTKTLWIVVGLAALTLGIYAFTMGKRTPSPPAP